MGPRRQRVFYVSALVSTMVRITVVAVDEQEARERAKDGAWRNCEPVPKTWDNTEVVWIGAVTTEDKDG